MKKKKAETDSEKSLLRKKNQFSITVNIKKQKENAPVKIKWMKMDESDFLIQIAWVEKEGRKRRGWKWVGFVVVGTRRSMSKCECATVMNRSGDLENLYLTKTRVWMAGKKCVQ